MMPRFRCACGEAYSTSLSHNDGRFPPLANRNTCHKCTLKSLLEAQRTTEKPFSSFYGQMSGQMSELRTTLAEKEDKLNKIKERLEMQESAFTFQITELRTELSEKEGNLSKVNERLVLQESAFTFQITELREILAEREARLEFLQLEVDDTSSNGSPTGDVVIVVQGRTDELLYAHKFILSSKSSVFRMMFENEMLEKESGVVRIDDATLPVMRAVIKYCYTAQIDFSSEVTPDEVLAVAHKYAIDFLGKVCEEQLTRTLDGGNLPKRLKLSKKFGAKGLQEAASRYLKENFDDVISNVLEEFCESHS